MLAHLGKSVKQMYRTHSLTGCCFVSVTFLGIGLWYENASRSFLFFLNDVVANRLLAEELDFDLLQLERHCFDFPVFVVIFLFQLLDPFFELFVLRFKESYSLSGFCVEIFEITEPCKSLLDLIF